MLILLYISLYICSVNSSKITIKHFYFMVELKLSFVDCLVLETLLSQLDSNLELGDSFKGLVSRFRSSLHESSILPVKGELLPILFNDVI